MEGAANAILPTLFANTLHRYLRPSCLHPSSVRFHRPQALRVSYSLPLRTTYCRNSYFHGACHVLCIKKCKTTRRSVASLIRQASAQEQCLTSTPSHYFLLHSPDLQNDDDSGFIYTSLEIPPSYSCWILPSFLRRLITLFPAQSRTAVVCNEV